MSTKLPTGTQNLRSRLRDGWQWATLGHVCNLVNGDAFKESDWSKSGVPIIRIQNLNDHSRPLNYWQGSLDDRVLVDNGDLLLAWSGTPGTSFGAHLWTRGRGVLNQHIFRVDLKREIVAPEWAESNKSRKQQKGQVLDLDILAGLCY